MDGWSRDGVNRIGNGVWSVLVHTVMNSLLVVLSCMMVHQSFSVFVATAKKRD